LLAAQYNLGNREPNVQVWSVDRRGDRSLTLRHQQHDRKPLGGSTDEVLKHLHRLWGFDVHLQSMQDDKLIATHHMPPRVDTDAEAKYPGMNLALPPI
jgi:stage V sporulation protein R